MVRTVDLSLCLRSPYLATKWRPGEAMEDDVRNGFGIYSLKNADEIKRLAGLAPVFMAPAPEAFWIPRSDRGFAWGLISMWGDIVEGPFGYRAQFARIASVDGVSPNDDAVLAALREKYAPNEA
jgi:hypothetical protein